MAGYLLGLRSMPLHVHRLALACSTLAFLSHAGWRHRMYAPETLETTSDLEVETTPSSLDLKWLPVRRVDDAEIEEMISRTQLGDKIDQVLGEIEESKHHQ